jgi:hypothetical protein
MDTRDPTLRATYPTLTQLDQPSTDPGHSTPMGCPTNAKMRALAGSTGTWDSTTLRDWTQFPAIAELDSVTEIWALSDVRRDYASVTTRLTATSHYDTPTSPQACNGPRAAMVRRDARLKRTRKSSRMDPRNHPTRGYSIAIPRNGHMSTPESCATWIGPNAIYAMQSPWRRSMSRVSLRIR